MRASVLVVDDDPLQTAIICQALGSDTYACAEAADGFAALEQMEASPADLVIIDMLMPGKDGIETIMAISRKWPAARIIAISGGGAGLTKDYLLDTAKALGAHAALRKPIARADIVGLVEELLGDCTSERGRD